MNYLEPVWMRSGPVPKGTGRRAARVRIPSLVVPWPTFALVGIMGSVQNVSQLEEFLGVHGFSSQNVTAYRPSTRPTRTQPPIRRASRLARSKLMCAPTTVAVFRRESQTRDATCALLVSWTAACAAGFNGSLMLYLPSAAINAPRRWSHSIARHVSESPDFDAPRYQSSKSRSSSEHAD